MKLIGKLALGLVGLLVALAVIVAVRTITYKAPSSADLTQVKLALEWP